MFIMWRPANGADDGIVEVCLDLYREDPGPRPVTSDHVPTTLAGAAPRPLAAGPPSWRLTAACGLRVAHLVLVQRAWRRMCARSMRSSWEDGTAVSEIAR